MNKFSIAPWKTAHSHSHEYIRYIRDAQGEHIAHVCDLADGIANDYADQALANARLMAAAPDLLEVISDLLDYAENATLENDEEPPVFQAARAAIARATGDQTVTA